MRLKSKLILVLGLCILIMLCNSCERSILNKENTNNSILTNSSLETNSNTSNRDFSRSILLTPIRIASLDQTSAPVPPQPSNFNINLQFGSTMTASQNQAIQNAVSKWESVITGDIPNTSNTPSHPCFNNNAHTLTGGAIDDLKVYILIEPIDGPYGILASAGPYYIRSSGKLPITGCMRFDSADVAIMQNNGSFEDVVLHELGHILGVGTIWDNLNLDSNCPNGFGFTGSTAIGEWSALGGTGNVPIESGGGSGTQCGHWSESIFNTELMTGYSEGGNPEQLSRLTIAQFTDLGYTTDIGQADTYSLPSCSGNCSSTALQTQITVTNSSEEVLQPVFEIDDKGNIKQIRKY